MIPNYRVGWCCIHVSIKHEQFGGIFLHETLLHFISQLFDDTEWVKLPKIIPFRSAFRVEGTFGLGWTMFSSFSSLLSSPLPFGISLSLERENGKGFFLSLFSLSPKASPARSPKKREKIGTLFSPEGTNSNNSIFPPFHLQRRVCDLEKTFLWGKVSSGKYFCVRSFANAYRMC